MLTAGVVSATNLSLNTLTITVTPATGGVPPYLYQFKRAPDLAGVPGGFVPIGPLSVALSFDDSGLTQDTVYWYTCTVTDNS